jgi:hypothetical protein
MELIVSGIGRHQRDKCYQQDKIGIACSGSNGEVTCGAQVIRGLRHQAREASAAAERHKHEKIGNACSGFKGEVTRGAQVIRGLRHQAGEAAPPFQNRRL